MNLTKNTVAVAAIVGVVVLEGVALAKGMDGIAFAGAIAAICSTVGAAYGVRLAMPDRKG